MSYTYKTNNTTVNATSILPGSTVGGTITLNNSGTGIGSIPPLTSSQIFTTTGTGGSSNWNGALTNGSTYAWSTPNDNVMVVKQDPASLEVKGKIIVNGQDLEERLDTIEKVLQIPERDIILEKKHPKLKELYDAYIHALGKYRTWNAIKGDDND
jgi:hypothetical protein